MRLLWLTLGGLSLAIGAIGIVLPLLPTTPFAILSAYCFARSSARLHDWLVTHRLFGPLIQDWREEGAIRRSAKIMATVSIGGVFALSLAMGIASKLLIIQGVTLSLVLLFIWSRPDSAAP